MMQSCAASHRSPRPSWTSSLAVLNATLLDAYDNIPLQAATPKDPITYRQIRLSRFRSVPGRGVDGEWQFYDAHLGQHTFPRVFRGADKTFGAVLAECVAKARDSIKLNGWCSRARLPGFCIAVSAGAPIISAQHFLNFISVYRNC